MPATNKHLPVAKPRRLPQHTSYELERLALKNRESSAMDRRLTSFCCASRLAYHRDKARETQCCKWSQCLQLQTKMSKLYVSPPRKYISRESCIHASIPLSRDGRQPSFTAHRLQRRKNSTWTVGFHSIYYTDKCGKVKQNKRFVP